MAEEWTPETGYAEAKRRIAAEVEARSGKLDLSGLSLEAIPPSITDIEYELELDIGFRSEGGLVDANQISDLAPLAGLQSLQSIDCSHTQVSDLAPLAGLQTLQSLNCYSTQVSDLAPLAGLQALQSLKCFGTKVSDLAPLAGLQALQSLNCSYTQVSHIAPLAGLQTLQSLNCYSTQVSDLAPLAGLQALQSIDCSHTQVSDLAPLAGLQTLQSLNCYSTQVSDLAPLAGLQALQSINCYGTKVSDLAPLADLQALQSIDCSYTQVSHIAPLAGLQTLQSLSCANTQVSDLAPLAGLQALQSLTCSSTPVSDLAPLAGLQTLQSLECSRTQVSDLAPLVTLPKLERVDLDYAHKPLSMPPPAEAWPAGLGEISLRFSSVKGLPSELYTGGALHRDAFKAYLDDLATAGAEARPRVKMIILGNGEVGKTQLRRRLQGEEFNPVWDSTHGIEAHSAHMDHPDYPKGVLINAWDFGGQDIYHGAHALFMRSNAVVVLCWHPDFEAGVEATSGELGIERKPLTYWLDFIAHTAGRDVPLILVRTRGRDRKAGEMLPDGASERLAQFAHAREAVIDTGEPPQNLDQFREQLRDAIGHLDAQFGAVHIGQSRMELAMGLAAMRESDQHYTDPAHKRFRTLTQERYAQYCETRLAPVSSPKHALDFLHHAGDVFYQEGLFDDRIVLDHNWALGAVYAVFNRSEKLVNELRRRGGRFTRDFLALALWDRAGHSEADQSLFLSMMVQCGIAFRASGKRSDDADAEYIAPALLPKLGETQTQFKDRWEDASPSAQTLARYGRIHAGFVHRLIAKYGELTEGQAIYWDTGVLIFDEETQARGRVDVDVEAGTVTLRTQPGLSGRGDTARLIKRLSEVRERVDRHFNLSPEIEGAVEVLEDQEQSPDSARLVAGFEPAPRPRFAISYAHPDRDAGETEIYEKIEALKPLIEERGWEFIYDQRDLPAGTDLPGFMKTISAADRVLTVFSPKYFRSRFCTSELIGAWDWSREDPRVFQSSVIAIGHPEIVLDDTGFWTNTHQHWATLAEELIQQVASTADVEGTSPLAGRKDLLLKFRRQIIPVLESLSSIIQPMSFDAFIERLDYYVPRHTK